jgi:hypothetical protein
MGGISVAVQVPMMIHPRGNAQSLVHYQFIREGNTVNKKVYVKILLRLTDALRRIHRKRA